MVKSIYHVALESYNCPKCKQSEGKDCRTPKGRIAYPPHIERLGQLTHADKDQCMGWTCAMCFGSIQKGDLIMWNASQRVAFHKHCYDKFHNPANR